MNIRPLVEADARAFAELCQNDFPYFRWLNDHRDLTTAARCLLNFEAYPADCVMYGVFEDGIHLQGIVRVERNLQPGEWEVAVAKAPNAQGISMTEALDFAMAKVRREKKRVKRFIAQVHHANSRSRSMLERLRFTLIGTEGRELLYQRFA